MSATLVLVANIALISSIETIFKKQIIAELKKQANSFLHIKDFGTNFALDSANRHKTMQLCLNNCECEVVCLPIFVGHKCNGMMILVQNLDKEKLAQNLRKEFSANVTHELKTPLTSILASSEMLRSKLVQSADVPRFLDKIYSESKRLLAMIDEILNLSFKDLGRK